MKLLRELKAYLLGERYILNSGNYPSMPQALYRLLGKKAWEKLISATPDRRQLVEEAARVKGVSEQELIKLLAEDLGIPVFFRPKIPDLDALPDGIILPELRRNGLLPLTIAGAVVGVVCVDPAALNQMPALYSGSNLYLSGWQSILAILDESEQIYLRDKASQALIEAEKQQELFKKILGRLFEQLKDRSSKQIYLVSDENSLHYSYKDQKEREWSGAIDASIGVTMARYLENAIAEGQSSFEALSSSGAIVLLNIRAEHGRMVIEPATPIPSIIFNSFEGPRSVPGESAKVVNFPRVLRNAEFFSAMAQNREELPLVLLVDDNPTFANVLKKFLEKQGLRIELRYSAEEALDWLQSAPNQSPDLLVSDLHMPGVGGMELIRQIKKDPVLSSIPVIALTSDECPETEFSLLEIGADAFVTKTKDPRILGLHVKRLIGLKRAA